MPTTLTTPRGVVTIRPAQAADAPAYRDLRLEGLRDHPEAFGSDYAVSQAQPMTYWEARLRALGPESAIYFAVCGQALIGTVGMYRGDSPKTCHSATLVGVYLQPAWRGLHLAEAMIASLLEWARGQGITIVKLGVVSTNTAAIRLYSGCGFKIYGIEPQAIYANGIYYDELLMVRSV
jgi:RimJ/RimL family protein N-acetyltransferase